MPNVSPRGRMPRAALVFALGLTLAAGTAISLDGAGAFLSRSFQGQVDLTSTSKFSRARAPLSSEERAAAETAWRYFERHTRPETGFVDSVAGFPSATLWDQGSYLLGLVSATRLGFVRQDEFDARVSQFVNGLSRLELFDGRLPNKVYDTLSLRMVDYTNVEIDGGIGWSALDIARLLMGLRVIEKHYPHHGAAIRSVLSGWDLDAMAVRGELMGFAQGPHVDGKLVQEGRIGYEQYGARAAALWGLDVVRAMSAERIVAWESVSGTSVPTDARRASSFGAITPLLSEPYLLLALELGLDAESAALAERVYDAQRARFEQTGILTMVSEDHLDAAPHFAYSSVISNGRPWAVVSEDGSFYDDMRTLSTKAAFGWHALVGDGYSKDAREQVSTLRGEDGFPAGIYESDGRVNAVYTLNTNGIILEALHYQVYGPLWSVR